MTPEQQRQAADLLRRALIFAPFRMIDRPGARKSLGNEIEEFLALVEVAEKEPAG